MKHVATPTPDKRASWVREPGTHEITSKGKLYKNLVRFQRPCAVCGEPFGIFVSMAVADGKAHNNNFGLKNCPKHRVGGGGIDLEKLRTANATMKAELEALYVRDKVQFSRIQELEARIAVYELHPAMQRVVSENSGHTTNSGLPKMPWQE